MSKNANDPIDKALSWLAKINESAELTGDEFDRALIVSALAGEVQRLRAREAAILKLHTTFPIYDDCGHDHSEDKSAVAFEIDGLDKLTCEDGYQYSVCEHCCIEGSDIATEWCMNHDHDKDKPICATVALLTDSQGDTP